MVKIALDPAMYHADLSVADEVRKAAELGYEYLELSPRADWFFWHRYPKADAAAIAEVKKACKETGVQMLTLVPVFNWSSPDEQERQAQVRNWRRLLEIADELECPHRQSELSGEPERPGALRARLLPVDGGADPGLRAVRDRAQPGGAPVRLHRDATTTPCRSSAGSNRPWVNYVFCAPHAFHLSDGAGDVRRMMEYAGGKTEAPAHRRLLQPQRERGQPLHHQPARGRRPRSTSTTRSATATSTGTSSSRPCASRTSTGSPRSACSAGRKTPTPSTGGCWRG